MEYVLSPVIFSSACGHATQIPTKYAENAGHHLKSKEHQEPANPSENPSKNGVGRLFCFKNLLQFQRYKTWHLPFSA